MWNVMTTSWDPIQNNQQQKLILESVTQMQQYLFHFALVLQYSSMGLILSVQTIIGQLR